MKPMRAAWAGCKIESVHAGSAAGHDADTNECWLKEIRTGANLDAGRIEFSVGDAVDHETMSEGIPSVVPAGRS